MSLLWQSSIIAIILMARWWRIWRMIPSDFLIASEVTTPSSPIPRLVGETGFEPVKRLHRVYSATLLARLRYPPRFSSTYIISHFYAFVKFCLHIHAAVLQPHECVQWRCYPDSNRGTKVLQTSTLATQS